MSTSLSSTYLIPAVLLNPVVILHGFNTFCSHFVYTALPVSTSQHQWLENLGPAFAPGPYFDVHANDQLCWGYTILMVLVQVLAYGTVNDTRVRRKSARAAAKAERERKAAQRDNKSVSEANTPTTANGHALESDKTHENSLPSHTKDVMNGSTHAYCAPDHKSEITRLEYSTTEPSSEEETIV
jgi:hypothetical protein